jgi:forkhead box protein K
VNGMIYSILPISGISYLARSQIQIASRTFHFNLPPPPAPEDSPSTSSQSSAHRPRSPSVDITSISPPSSMPSHSPPPGNSLHPPPRPSQPRETHPPKSTFIRNPNANAKKRKKSNPAPLPIPKPEDMPPRPPLTYAQLCYRAIKATGGKATLQEINQWIMESFDWYKYNDAGWQVRVLFVVCDERYEYSEL